ncbi:hypothetical protein ACRAWF_38405, partial [Streptomyces sp. L7]
MLRRAPEAVCLTQTAAGSAPRKATPGDAVVAPRGVRPAHGDHPHSGLSPTADFCNLLEEKIDPAAQPMDPHDPPDLPPRRIRAIRSSPPASNTLDLDHRPLARVGVQGCCRAARPWMWSRRAPAEMAAVARLKPGLSPSSTAERCGARRTRGGQPRHYSPISLPWRGAKAQLSFGHP